MFGLSSCAVARINTLKPRQKQPPCGALIMALSRRGQVIASIAEKFAFLDILKNLWDPKTNPDGFVSLGVAENVGGLPLP